jgi:hypothetical protein
MRSIGGTLAAILAVALGGCTSLRGSQDSALTSAQTVIGAANSDYANYLTIMNKYNELKGDEAEQMQFRNRVLMIYMDAIDENYKKYSADLFSEGIQSGLAFDTGIIGLSAMGALFEDSAKDMATIISAASGVHAAVDKDLYFDRTLPALISTMDANRAKVEAEILGKMKLSTKSYPIEGAMRDLRQYQEAGLLYRAITDVTGTAAEKKQEAQNKVDKIELVSLVPADVQKRREPLADKLKGASDAELKNFLLISGKTPGDVPLVQALDLVDESITAGDVDTLCQRLKLAVPSSGGC